MVRSRVIWKRSDGLDMADLFEGKCVETSKGQEERPRLGY